MRLHRYRTGLGVGMVVFALVMMGCDALFEYNVFSGLDPVPSLRAQDVADLSAAQILQQLENPEFILGLEEGDAAREIVLETLQTALDGGNSAAGEALIQVYLEGTPAGDVVNNLFDGALDVILSGESDLEPEDLLALYLPEGMGQADLAVALDALIGISQTMDTLHGQDALVPSGDLVQAAFVASFVQSLDSALLPDYQDSPGEALAALVFDQEEVLDAPSLETALSGWLAALNPTEENQDQIPADLDYLGDVSLVTVFGGTE